MLVVGNLDVSDGFLPPWRNQPVEPCSYWAAQGTYSGRFLPRRISQENNASEQFNFSRSHENEQQQTRVFLWRKQRRTF
jgi:hypothetical protein